MEVSKIEWTPPFSEDWHDWIYGRINGNDVYTIVGYKGEIGAPPKHYLVKYKTLQVKSGVPTLYDAKVAAEIDRVNRILELEGE